MKKNKDIQIVLVAFLGVIASVSGWLVFSGIEEIFNLESISPTIKIVLGLFSVWLLYKFGLNNIKFRK